MKYTEEMIQFIRDYAEGHSRKEITEKFNETYKTNQSDEAIGSCMKRNHIRNNRNTRFGSVIAWNKGKKLTPEQYARSYPTMFKKGNIPKNHKPVGAEKINADGYVEIKISEPNKWMQKHRLLWEEKNGKIPKECVIMFKDQNKLNVTIDNLIMVKKAYTPLLNRMISNIPEITESNAFLAGLIVETKKAKRRARSKQNE